MSSGGGGGRGEFLADRYASLWEEGAVPDVFAFLGAHPTATVEERVEVVRVDQRRRWPAGVGRPVEHYLIGAPEIAAQTELIELLIDEERRVREEFGGATVAETAETTIEGRDQKDSFSLHEPPSSATKTDPGDPSLL